MKITDVITITELAKLLNKSRPTVYKYIEDYERGCCEGVPQPVVNLFNQITKENIAKRDVYDYCNEWFLSGGYKNDKFEGKKEQTVTEKDVIKLIKDNRDKIDFNKLKRVIEEDLRK